MRTIELQDLMRGNEFTNVRTTLADGGIVCLPCRTSYRIVADLTNPSAVNALLHSKHRTRKAPSLVFISDISMLKMVAKHIPAQAKLLAKALWPGELTIRLDPNENVIPEEILKSLTKGQEKLGVRIPSEPWIQRILRDLERPLLVSSANREKKTGASSPAQIRKNFVSHVNLFIDAGDLLPNTIPSTVIEFKDDVAHIKREGSITRERIERILAENAE